MVTRSSRHEPLLQTVIAVDPDRLDPELELSGFLEGEHPDEPTSSDDADSINDAEARPASDMYGREFDSKAEERKCKARRAAEMENTRQLNEYVATLRTDNSKRCGRIMRSITSSPSPPPGSDEDSVIDEEADMRLEEIRALIAAREERERTLIAATEESKRASAQAEDAAVLGALSPSAAASARPQQPQQALALASGLSEPATALLEAAAVEGGVSASPMLVGAASVEPPFTDAPRPEQQPQTRAESPALSLERAREPSNAPAESDGRFAPKISVPRSSLVIDGLAERRGKAPGRGPSSRHADDVGDVSRACHEVSVSTAQRDDRSA